ncbi:putative S-adenosylmethionine-dependent methyltransferase [mine drainage metagenome]|uniref:Putative S-adenosylmethionine-dependent methyltransferase n=1 Tax=mine drainage metagenome TaxID=410659 RepID=A0A1J5RI27_9ZZZZ
MVWHAIGLQLRHPRGWPGRLIGHVMRLANHRPNRLAVDALELVPGQHVLELGCGPGAAVARMAARGARVTGIDQSEAMLAQARRRNRRHVVAGQVALRLGQWHRLPVADGAADRVLAVNVAYFWEDAAGVLAEIRRVLAQNGLLVLYVTAADSMRGWKFADAATHRLYDEDSLAALLSGGGFVLADLRRVRAGPGVAGLVARCRKAPVRKDA